MDFILILFILNSRERKGIHSELANKIRNSLWIRVADVGFIVYPQKIMESKNYWIPEKNIYRKFEEKKKDQLKQGIYFEFILNLNRR